MSNNFQYWNLSDKICDCLQKLTLLDSRVTSLQNIINQIDYKSMQDKIAKLEADIKELKESSGG